MWLVAQDVNLGFAEQTVPCLFAAVVGGILVIVLVFAWIKAKERREAFQRLAGQIGFQFNPKDVWDIPTRYGHLSLFQSGHSRKAKNVLVGAVDGRETLLFDYQYTVGSGKNSHTYYFQASIFETPILSPQLILRRENMLDRVASWVGHDDINFESEEFSKLTHVKCTDRKFAYDIFHARLIDWLLQCGDLPSMEFNGPLLILYTGQGRVEQVRRLLDIGQEIIRSIPDYVMHERGTGATAGGGR
jgi:hypothetical protein